MKHLSTQMKQQQIEWRRAKVLELSSQGYSEREIAEKLQPLAPGRRNSGEGSVLVRITPERIVGEKNTASWE